MLRALLGILSRSRAADVPAPDTGETDELPVPPAVAPDAPAVEPVAPRSSFVPPTEYLVPADLAVTSLPVARVLAIGSCFLRHAIGRGVAAEAGLHVEFLLATQIADMPETPPAPIETYACQLIQIPLRALINDAMFTELKYPDIAAYQAAFERSCQGLRLHLERRMKWNIEAGTPTFVMNFMQPQFNAMGRFFPRFDLRNPEYFVTMLNQELERLVAGYRGSHILDVDRLAASFGRRHVQDDLITVFGHNAEIAGEMRAPGRIEPLGAVRDYYDLQPGRPFRQAIAAELRAMLRTLRQIDSVKLVVVDLDDTLWNGVSGDTADVGGHVTEGWPVGLVEALNYLLKRGILLAIISKNDEARIRAIWRKIFGARLRLEHFSAVRINWRPKAENMAEILQAINLLPRNVVFIDDNPVERAQMRAAFPDMRTLGANPFHLRRILLEAPETQPVSVSAESAQRTAMVQSQLQREADRTAVSLETFLRQQNVRVRMLRIADRSHPRLPRALELINKTNQFNTTGRRWTEPEIDGFFAAGGSMAAYEVEDRYTEYGLVGVVLLHGRAIVQWVMSCRVIGFCAEHAAMCEIVAELRQSKAVAITATLTANDVNQPCQDFFRAAGFAERNGAWVLDADTAPRRAEYVTMVA